MYCNRGQERLVKASDFKSVGRSDTSPMRKTEKILEVSSAYQKAIATLRTDWQNVQVSSGEMSSI